MITSLPTFCLFSANRLAAFFCEEMSDFLDFGSLFSLSPRFLHGDPFSPPMPRFPYIGFRSEGFQYLEYGFLSPFPCFLFHLVFRHGGVGQTLNHFRAMF